MEFKVYDVALVPLIVSLVSVLRAAGLPVRWLPLAAIILGLAGGFMYIAPHDPKQAVLAGLVMGTAAIGAYSGYKNTFRK